MSVKRERSVNFSREETDFLIKLISDNKHIIENKKSDSVTWQEKETCWKSIEASFNCLNGVTYRTAKTLKIKYEGLKRETRKKSALIRAETYRTGGGTNKSPVLSTNEDKIKRMILLSVEGTDSTFDCDNVNSIEATTQKICSAEHSNNVNQDTSNNDENLYDEINEILIEANEILADGETEEVICEKSSLSITPSSSNLTSKIANSKIINSNTENLHSENKWAQWKPKVLRSKKHPVLSNPKTKRPFERVAESKLEIAELQKIILKEELEDKRNRCHFEEEERNHKREMWKLEKEYLQKKIK